MKKALIALALLALPHTAAAASSIITGPARIIDGDTVVVGATHVRLKGVDAAEMNTDLGRKARDVMVKIVGSSSLTCELTGEKTYKRDVGFCETDDGVDIAEAIITSGAALSCPNYSTRYVRYEQPTTQARARYCGDLPVRSITDVPRETSAVPLPRARPHEIGWRETVYCDDEPGAKGCPAQPVIRKDATWSQFLDDLNWILKWLIFGFVVACLFALGKRYPWFGLFMLIGLTTFLNSGRRSWRR